MQLLYRLIQVSRSWRDEVESILKDEPMYKKNLLIKPPSEKTRWIMSDDEFGHPGCCPETEPVLHHIKRLRDHEDRTALKLGGVVWRKTREQVKLQGGDQDSFAQAQQFLGNSVLHRLDLVKQADANWLLQIG